MSETVPFRLAFRHEGKFVNVYLAKPDQMEGAVLLASMVAGLLEHPDTWREFQSLMRLATSRGGLEFGDAVTTPAPEHERAGRG